MTPQQPGQPGQPGHPDTIASGSDAPRRSRLPRGLLAAVVVLGLVVAVASGAALAGDGAGLRDQLAFSAAGSATATADERRERERDRDGDRGDRGGVDGFRGRGHASGHGFGHRPGGGALHGSFVLPHAGGYRTVVTQRGEVTAVSDSSLTVRSADGFVATYRITEDTDVLGGTGGIGDIAEGDQVRVAGGRTTSVNTATHVIDMARAGARF